MKWLVTLVGTVAVISLLLSSSLFASIKAVTLTSEISSTNTKTPIKQGAIATEKIESQSTGIVQEQETNILLSEDSYFYNFLNSKVRLTELGLYILDSIKAEPIRFEQPS